LRQLIRQDLVDLQHLLDPGGQLHLLHQLDLVDRRLQQRQLNLLLRQDLEDLQHLLDLGGQLHR
jgi:hypothetical protein